MHSEHSLKESAKKKKKDKEKQQQIGMAEPKMTLKVNLSAPFFKVFFFTSCHK